AAVELMIRSSTHTSLRQLGDEAALVHATTGADIEVRYVAIPGDWKDPASDTGMFDKRTMDSLASLGMKMGADPSSWTILPENIPLRPSPAARAGAMP